VVRVLLTGAGGFAGHHCLEHLLVNTDWEIVCTDSFQHRGKTDRISEVLAGHPDWRARVTVVTHDLSAPFSRQAFLSMAGDIDYMVCYASESHVDRSIADPVPFTMNNVAIALNTLEAARVLQPLAVVWVSTDEVYGPLHPGQPAFREWAVILPSNPYAGSKAAQEAVCTAYWRTYGVPVIIVNCMNMIGERQDPEKFVPRVIRAVLRGEQAVIHGSPGDVGTRHYLHSRNLADGILHLLRGNAAVAFPLHTRPARYNVASADRIDNLTMAQLIAESAGLELYYRFEDFHTTRPGHDPHYGLSPQKITELGWKPPVPFRESLDRLVRWTVAHQEWLEE
jgi:dTDP-glucose 4,6-dehydratase